MMQKNYQIWHHRRCIFEMYARKVARTVLEATGETEVDFVVMKDEPAIKEMFTEEMEFLDDIFKGDAKNYHAWSHKYWLVERFSLAGDPELRYFIEQMLDDDVRNNSVWSFRYFVQMRKQAEMPFMLLAQLETKYVVDLRLHLDWRNEAAWAYLRGFIAATQKEAQLSEGTNTPRLHVKKLDVIYK